MCVVALCFMDGLLYFMDVHQAILDSQPIDTWLIVSKNYVWVRGQCPDFFHCILCDIRK